MPFNLSKDREVRNSFRKFMGENPDKFDYKTAQIPAPLDKEEEEERERKASEKKRAQREKKREKEKALKGEEAKLKAEEAEKERFLNLTDREKRALAAERRLMGRWVFKILISYDFTRLVVERSKSSYASSVGSISLERRPSSMGTTGFALRNVSRCIGQETLNCDSRNKL